MLFLPSALCHRTSLHLYLSIYIIFYIIIYTYYSSPILWYFFISLYANGGRLFIESVFSFARTAWLRYIKTNKRQYVTSICVSRGWSHVCSAVTVIFPLWCNLSQGQQWIALWLHKGPALINTFRTCGYTPQNLRHAESTLSLLPASLRAPSAKKRRY